MKATKAPNAKKRGKSSSPSVYVELDLGNSQFDINKLFPAENETIGSFVYHPEIVSPTRSHDPYRVMRSGGRRRSASAIATAKTLVMAPLRLVVGLLDQAVSAAQSLAAKPAVAGPTAASSMSFGITKPAFLSGLPSPGALRPWLVPAGATAAVVGLSTVLWMGMGPSNGPVVDQILAQNGAAKLSEVQKLAAQPGIVNATRTRIVDYTVKTGDTVSSLAARFQVSEATLRGVNGLMPNGKLKPGQVLKVLPVNGVLHKLGKGETAFALAGRYGVSMAKLQEANRNVDMDHLRIGQTLIIPGASNVKQAPAPAVAKRHAQKTVTPVARRPAAAVTRRHALAAPIRTASVDPRHLPANRKVDRGARTEQHTSVSRSLGSGEREHPIVQSGHMLFPTTGAWSYSSGFGWRHARFHSGVDIANAPGSTIRAARDGVVVSASYDGAYGNAVVISHGNGVTTRYAHCSRMLVSPGQRVEAGQPIAAVGTTGRATGPHVHFEVRINGSAVDPRGYL